MVVGRKRVYRHLDSDLDIVMETTVNFDSNRHAPLALRFRLKSRRPAAKFARPAITHLEALESESIHDSYARNRATGSFIMIDDASHNTVAAGMIV